MPSKSESGTKEMTVGVYQQHGRLPGSGAADDFLSSSVSQGAAVASPGHLESVPKTS
jgi:hypothetical protein